MGSCDLSNFVVMHGWMDDHYVASGWGNVGITEDTRPMTNHSNEAVSHPKFWSEDDSRLFNMADTRGPLSIP